MSQFVGDAVKIGIFNLTDLSNQRMFSVKQVELTLPVHVEKRREGADPTIVINVTFMTEMPLEARTETERTVEDPDELTDLEAGMLTEDVLTAVMTDIMLDQYQHTRTL